MKDGARTNFKLIRMLTESHVCIMSVPYVYIDSLKRFIKRMTTHLADILGSFSCVLGLFLC